MQQAAAGTGLAGRFGVRTQCIVIFPAVIIPVVFILFSDGRWTLQVKCCLIIGNDKRGGAKGAGGRRISSQWSFVASSKHRDLCPIENESDPPILVLSQFLLSSQFAVRLIVKDRHDGIAADKDFTRSIDDIGR